MIFQVQPGMSMLVLLLQMQLWNLKSEPYVEMA